MKDRGNLRTWSYWELLKEERRWGKHDMNAEEIRTEIERRREHWKTLALWLSFPVAILAAVFTIANYFHAK